MKKTLLAAAFVAAFIPSSAHAIANPAAINWTASPAAFVTSLYTGVLGRAPENAAVVNGWASSITASPASRLQVFNGFINSAEHKRATHSKGKREYFVFVKHLNHKKSYTVAKRTPTNGYHSSIYGPTTWRHAKALQNYHEAFFWR